MLGSYLVELSRKVAAYSKSERIVRIIEIEIEIKEKGNFLSFIELMMIQEIRTQNGEIEEVMKNRNEEFKK